MRRFKHLQADLGEAWRLNQPGGDTPHVMVVMPSFSLGETILSHYAARLPALEHRYVLARFLLRRIPGCEMVYVSTVAPDADVIDYYTNLAPEADRHSLRNRYRSIPLPDHSHRSIAEKLLDRPDLIESIKMSFAGRPAFIEPWNVTEHEVAVAEALGIPINGTAPDLWPLGFKSSGRKLFREAGVPLPYGFEDVRDTGGIIAAIDAVRRERPQAPGVVVKHDNSASGDGNMVIRFGDGNADIIRSKVEALPDWYRKDLQAGGIVEELIAGTLFSSPSAQVDVTPFGEVRVLATHEQVLGGSDGQVYMGCRLPAASAYAGELGRHARAIGEVLAQRGVVGRFSVDFAAAVGDDGLWHVYALEVNLRKGGTTHPYAALRNLAPGHYDVSAGQWLTEDGTPRAYASTDNLVDEAWHGLPAGSAIAAVRNAGLEFDHRTGTGVVLHMLSCLAIDGRLGLTAIGRTPVEAQLMYDAIGPALNEAART